MKKGTACGSNAAWATTEQSTRTLPGNTGVLTSTNCGRLESIDLVLGERSRTESGCVWHRVDALIPDWNVTVEADGRIWHTRVSDFDSDRARDNELAAMGYQVIRFTYSMLKNQPERCIETLLAVGANRRATRDGIRNAVHDGSR